MGGALAQSLADLLHEISRIVWGGRLRRRLGKVAVTDGCLQLTLSGVYAVLKLLLETWMRFLFVAVCLFNGRVCALVKDSTFIFHLLFLVLLDGTHAAICVLLVVLQLLVLCDRHLV